jgi:hypothetical protein
MRTSIADRSSKPSFRTGGPARWRRRSRQGGQQVGLRDHTEDLTLRIYDNHRMRSAVGQDGNKCQRRIVGTRGSGFRQSTFDTITSVDQFPYEETATIIQAGRLFVALQMVLSNPIGRERFCVLAQLPVASKARSLGACRGRDYRR